MYLSIDIPGPPQPPFEISDIDADACSLSWHIPLEDGGSPITNYVVEKCDVSRGDWITVVASVTKTNCRLGKLTPGQEYMFRVRAENRFGISEPLQSDKMVARFQFGMSDCPFILLSPSGYVLNTVSIIFKNLSSVLLQMSPVNPKMHVLPK